MRRRCDRNRMGAAFRASAEPLSGRAAASWDNCTYLWLVARKNRAAALCTRRPVQYLRARKMAAGVNQGRAANERPGVAAPELEARIGPHHPALVVFMQKNASVEGAAPLDHRRIIVWMRNGDCFDAAPFAHRADACIVEHREAVPEDIPVRRGDQNGSLRDRESRLGVNGE